jgi:hypothetical protein
MWRTKKYMTRKILLSFAILAVSAVASAKSYTVTFFQPSIVGGAELQPGEYKLDLNESKVTIRSGKKSAEATVKVESADQKFPATSVRYQNGDGKYRIQEIRLGGTTTKLVFN